jgi:D-glycero-alpha-D-manno-heptose 1-phosphate guanylyltransferase
MAVKQVMHQDRYGVLSIENNRIIDFNEKTFVERGYINGGIYMLPPGVFKAYDMPYSFSLEQDFFGAYKSKLHIQPYYSEGYFIDIGIPDDYKLAQTTIPSLFLPKIDASWTLFLDRDGVINEHRPADYVKNEDEFIFIDGSVEAISALSKIFGKTLVVTNQQGIGKGMMSEYDLEKIHWKMQNRITAAGGKIDRVYYCPHVASIQSNCRKPNIGMALEAQRDFPSIDFSKSIMIGDMDTDMEFGMRAGMFTIKIGESITKKESLKFSSLRDFSVLLKNSL